MTLALDSTALDALFELPGNDGVFPPELRDYLGTLGARRPAIVLAFPPKAAGTFLRTAAIRATGGELLRVIYAQGSRDAQFYLPTLMAYYLGGFCDGPLVTHIHMQGFPANIAFLEAFDMRPVVMVRSIPDMLSSYWDMLENDDAALHQGLNCTIPADFRRLTADRKADFLIDVLGPWYAGYYATWLDYAAHSGDRLCMLTYADFLRDPHGCLARILAHAGVPQSVDACAGAIEAVWSERHAYRFNKGEEGRAHRYFAIRHFERIAKLLSFYPSTVNHRAELVGI